MAYRQLWSASTDLIASAEVLTMPRPAWSITLHGPVQGLDYIVGLVAHPGPISRASFVPGKPCARGASALWTPSAGRRSSQQRPRLRPSGPRPPTGTPHIEELRHDLPTATDQIARHLTLPPREGCAS
jgi:hypothetical protein